MYVSGMYVKGFYSLSEVSVTFQPGMNVIVGKNNAGKSNLIRALDYILGEKYPTYHEFEERSFFCLGDGHDGVDSATIIVSLSGHDLNKEKIREIGSSAKIYTCHGKPLFRDMESWISEAEHGTFNWLKYSKLADVLERTGKVYLFLYVPRQSSRENAMFGMIYEVDGVWYLLDKPNGRLRDALLTTAYVPSFRDPGNQLRINKYSWYGKLVQKLYARRTHEQADRIRNIQDEHTQLLEEVFKDATTELTTVLRDTVFHHAVRFRPGANTRDDDYKNMMLFVDDGLDAPFYDKGSGIQSALIIALFTYYCRSFHRGSSLMLVEEPELYLHPQARRALETTLTAFALEARAGHQVIISTHSPEFLRSVTADRLVVVKKEQGSCASEAKQIHAHDFVVRDAGHLVSRNAEMVFADHVILVEGGEEHIVPALANLALEKSGALDYANVSVVRVEGKGVFRRYVDLLGRFGIGWTILTDLDFLRNGVDQFSGALSNDNEAKLALGHIRKEWNIIKELPLQGRVFRDKIFDSQIQDFKQLYSAVDEALTLYNNDEVPSADAIKDIRRLWDRLSSRVYRVNYSRLWETCESDLKVVLSRLKQNGIFALAKGDLESCLTEKALQLSRSKERRAYMIGEELSRSKSLAEAEEWIDCSGIIEMLDSVAKKTGIQFPNRGQQQSNVYHLESDGLGTEINCPTTIEVGELPEGG